MSYVTNVVILGWVEPEELERLNRAVSELDMSMGPGFVDVRDMPNVWAGDAALETSVLVAAFRGHIGSNLIRALRMSEIENLKNLQVFVKEQDWELFKLLKVCPQ